MPKEEIRNDNLIIGRNAVMPLMTWATHVLQWALTEGSKIAIWSKPLKTFSVQIAGCNPPA